MSDEQTQAEQFADALKAEWAANPDRRSGPDSSHFWAAAAETYMQQRMLWWHHKVDGFDPNDMKDLGRWLRDVYQEWLAGAALEKETPQC